MKTLWNEQTITQATGGEARGHWHASRVEIDSRKVQLGDLFVAIKGERVDGHHYVADALARGAVAAVVSHVPEGLPRTAALVVVRDTLVALTDMAKYARARTDAKIIGITGSVGKTSTKEMVKLALATHGKTYANAGNFNNHIGTPLSLANLPGDAKFGVFEMGMNHAGEIAHLVSLVRPDVAIITNVEAVHLEFFKDVQGIADAKAEIFSSTPETAIVNADNPFADYLANKAKKAGTKKLLTFGFGNQAEVRVVSYESTTKGAEIVIKTGDETLSFSIKATGRHFASVAATTLAVANALGLPLPKTAAALADFTESDGRGKAIKLESGAWLIDDSYNASPASMKAAFAKTAEVWEQKGKKGRKIAALGDMLELGATAPTLHAGLAEALIQQGFDLVFTAGPLMKHLHDALPKDLRAGHVMEAKFLLPLIQKTLLPDDVLLVKGSHGSKMYEVSNLLSVSGCQQAKASAN